LATAAACVAISGGAALPAGAAAEQTVVSATIFPGTAGTQSTQAVLLSTLAQPGCTPYTGPSWTFSNGQAPLTTDTVWSLGEILTCSLGTTDANVTAVKVFNGDTSRYESTLTPDQVFNVATYPSGALPLISVDGSTTSGGPVTYTRPPTGPSDDAQSDQFTEDGTTPISIDVYENQLPLNVTPAPVYGTSTASSEMVTLAATVTGADGAAIDPSQLSWSWMFAGSAVGSAATPAVTVAAGASELASVIVTDQATGAAGTETFPVTYNPSPSPPATQQPPGGAGDNNKGGATGKDHGKKRSHGKQRLKHGDGLAHAGTNPGAGKTGFQRHPATPSQTSTATTPATTPAAPPVTNPTVPPAVAPAVPPTIQTTTVTTTTPTTNPGLTVVTSPTKFPRRKRPHAPKRRSVARPGASQRMVTGRLVADVQTLPAGASSLVHPIAAQAGAPALVHAASDGTSAPTWAYAALAVLALLGGGALYERRGRTLHR
jgi:hypothetical protein